MFILNCQYKIPNFRLQLSQYAIISHAIMELISLTVYQRPNNKTALGAFFAGI